jgi:hypothetical protein
MYVLLLSFLYFLQILAFSIIYLQPVSRSWSIWAYSKLTIMLIVSQGLKIHTANGMPASWSLDGIKQWLMRVLPTADAQYFLLAFAAAGNKPTTALLPPYLVLAAYHLVHFLSETFPQHPLWQQHGQYLYRQMQAKQQAALAFNAQAEIGLGFMLLVGIIFPGRAPMFAFMVWSFLRMRYWSADAAVYHRQVRGRRQHTYMQLGRRAGGWGGGVEAGGDPNCGARMRRCSTDRCADGMGRDGNGADSIHAGGREGGGCT